MGRYIFPLIFSIGAVLSLRAQWVQVPSGVSDSLTAITAVEGAFYVAGGNGVFLRSFDGGNSFVATPGYGPIFGVHAFGHLTFFDQITGFGAGVGWGGGLQKTTDGGMSWDPPSFNDQSAVTPMVIALNDSDLVLFRSGAAMQFSYNTGQVLFESMIDIYVDIDSICPPSPWCQYETLGDDTLTLQGGSYGWTLTSPDRGNSISSGYFPYTGYVLMTEQIGPDTVFHLSLSGSAQFSLFRSLDRGISWNIGYPVPHYISIYRSGMYWSNANNGSICTSYGRIFITNNAGQSWDSIPTPTTEHLNDIHFTNDQQGWAVGENGTIIATIDGGQTWFLENSGVSEDLTAIASDDQAVIIIGHNGTILRRDLTVAIPEPADADQISITVADPIGKRLLITSDLPIEEVQLLDVTGRLLIDEKAIGSSSHSITAPSSGIFLCLVRSGKGTLIGRRIVVP